MMKINIGMVMYQFHSSISIISCITFSFTSKLYINEHHGLIGTSSLAGRVLWNRVHLSFHLHFLGIVQLVFSKFWHDAIHSYEVVRDRAGFSRKNVFVPKIGKLGQKWTKNGFFWIYWKILVLIFTEFNL